MDNETESVLRASFKAVLGDQYRDDLHLCRLAGMVENRLLTLNRIALAANDIIIFQDLHWHHPAEHRHCREDKLKSALADLPNAKMNGPKAPV
jgi:hypothetical protein